MGSSGQHEFFLRDDAGQGEPGARAGGPAQSATAEVDFVNGGGPPQGGITAAVIGNSGGPPQSTSPLADPVKAGGPLQSTSNTSTTAQGGGPAQSTNDQLVIGDVDGQVEGRAAGGRAHTVPGGLGIAVEDVEAGSRPTVNLVESRSLRWGARQIVGGTVEVLPLVDGVVDIIDRIMIDATAAAFDTDLKALFASWGPDGAANPRRFFPTEILFRPTAIAGLTSHPIFSIGANSPTFDDTRAGMDLAAGGGAVVGATKVFLVPPNAEAYFEETTPGALTLRLGTPAVATTYDVEVIVRGYHTRAALLDS